MAIEESNLYHCQEYEAETAVIVNSAFFSEGKVSNAWRSSR